MTTATDWDDATWTDTGSHAIVTDVTSAATEAPVLTAEHALALEQANHQLSEQIVAMHTEWQRIHEHNLTLQAELATLRSELNPLDGRRTGWTPRPSTMPAKHWTDVHSVDDLTEQQQRAALVAPTLAEVRDGDGEDYLGATVAAELMAGTDHKPGWPTWLGDLHHADATLGEQVAGVRSWAEDYTAHTVERTIVEPVEVDTSYRESEAWTWADMVLAGRDRETGAVLAGPYSELAPDKIQANEGESPKAITPAAEMKASANSDGPTHSNGHNAVTTPPPAETAHRAGVLASLAQPATQVGGQGETYNETPPRVGGWRVWAASVAIGIVGLATTIGALVVWA